MHRTARAQISGRIQLLEDGDPKGLPITVVGRDWWALQELIRAGERGCTPISNPAPRWGHYVWKLRQAGVDVETVHEKHGGRFPGHHARYVLRSRLAVLEDVRAAA